MKYNSYEAESDDILTLQDVQGVCQHPLSDAALLLGKSVSKFKLELKGMTKNYWHDSSLVELGVSNWPYRKIRSIQEKIRQVETKQKQTGAFSEQLQQLNRELVSAMTLVPKVVSVAVPAPVATVFVAPVSTPTSAFRPLVHKREAVATTARAHYKLSLSFILN